MAKAPKKVAASLECEMPKARANELLDALEEVKLKRALVRVRCHGETLQQKSNWNHQVLDLQFERGTPWRRSLNRVESNLISVSLMVYEGMNESIRKSVHVGLDVVVDVSIALVPDRTVKAKVYAFESSRPFGTNCIDLI